MDYVKAREQSGSPASAPTGQYAGFMPRAAAYLLDGLILSLPWVLILTMVSVVSDVGKFLTTPSATLLVAQLFGSLVAIAYCTLMHASKWQATLGKRAVGIKVETRDGQRLSIKTAAWRIILVQLMNLPSMINEVYFLPDTNTVTEDISNMIPSLLIELISVAWFLPAAFTKEKTAVHDMIMGTRVVYTEKYTGKTSLGTKLVIGILIGIPVIGVLLALGSIYAMMHIGDIMQAVHGKPQDDRMQSTVLHPEDHIRSKNPLNRAIESGNLEEAYRLIDETQDVNNAVESWGYTPLFYAVMHNDNPEIVRKLLAKGANVRATDRYGNTPLMMAVANADDPFRKHAFEVIQMLYNAGSDSNAKNSVGNSPLSLAQKEIKDKRVLQLFTHQN